VATEHDRRLAEYEHQVGELQDQRKSLDEEIVLLRRRLQDAPKRVRTLEERILETKGQLAQAVSQNERLSATLREAREHIAALREEVEKLTMPPSGYGTLLGANDDGTVDVFTAGRKMRVAIHPELDAASLKRGQEVVLNESLNVVLARGVDTQGEVVVFKELLEDGRRALIIGRADEERIAELAEDLLGVKLRAGEHVLVDAGTGVGDLTLDELASHCATQIARYKLPRELHLVESMQRSPAGKADYAWAKDVATAST